MKQYPKYRNDHYDDPIKLNVLIDCEIYRTFDYIYLLSKTLPHKNEFMFNEERRIHQIKTIDDEFIETTENYNLIFDHHKGHRWIVATNDSLLNSHGVPAIPKLWDRLETIKVKMHRVNLRPDVYGGMSMPGEYRCDLKPELTKHGQVITSF